ncbi:M48 family metalloprotease [Micavibrio aeruginosavorus]|uniref:Putative Zn-dependent protease, contains TPR repeats n=1 Tax=Micavibrio aeruginosavorus EPB TaxID=349215 RepID=M4VKK5_9BACT|nr:M48 family metalloprotease [Micavibrio aeruginosavorus]AGH99015.1 Putative Zn-dependent protease, contains TPR repeats [Micavibrio aeruginosavorus EPB]
MKLFRHRGVRPVLGFVMLTGLLLGSVGDAFAQNSPTLIRDTEIEKTIEMWAEPVVRAAGLDPKSVNFILVQDSSLNAFVAGGQNVFIYTGLIQRTKTPEELIGVIAHELGHISGGHLIRTRQALEEASYETILGALIGIGAAIATGDGGAASAVSMGSRSMAERRFMAFSRVQESSADQAGLSYMSKAGLNGAGFLSFMKQMENEELLPASQQSEYVRTHPLTRDRIQAVETVLQGNSFDNAKPVPASWNEEHARMIAKLVGFITPEQVPWVYADRDTSVAARYARAIAAYRQNRVNDALGQMDALLKDEPENPYFNELKGQMLVDFGKVKEAVPFYRKAVNLDSNAPLLRVSYAHALIESDVGGASLGEAITQLQKALRTETRSPRVHRLLATAYGKQGNDPMARLHLAEEALLQRNNDYAKRQAEVASQGLKKGSAPWIRAQDILSHVEQSADKD